MYLAHPVELHPIAVDPEPTLVRELREFIAGDDPPLDADPAFREQLREQLWTMLSAGHADPTTDR